MYDVRCTMLGQHIPYLFQSKTQITSYIVHRTSYICHPMVIAVNTKYFLKAYQQVYLEFIYECFSRIANHQPLHTFIFISDTAFDPSFSFSENSIPLAIMPKINAGILSGILYKIKITSLLKNTRQMFL